jgi:hypothetical protein
VQNVDTDAERITVEDGRGYGTRRYSLAMNQPPGTRPSADFGPHVPGS